MKSEDYRIKKSEGLGVKSKTVRYLEKNVLYKFSLSLLICTRTVYYCNVTCTCVETKLDTTFADDISAGYECLSLLFARHKVAGLSRERSQQIRQTAIYFPSAAAAVNVERLCENSKLTGHETKYAL